MPSDPQSVFVVGTDTGVGKTHVCAGLLRGLVASGWRAVGMKPVAAGAARDEHGQYFNDDARALITASNIAVAPALYNPVLLREPLSPHLAAAHEGVTISLPHILQAYQALRAQADVVIVEGAGGFLVPLGQDAQGTLVTGADLARALGLPLLLVVGMRLGCLNHALLTAQAIAARGLRLAGWIANRIDPDMQCADENVTFLSRHLPAPMLADVPHAGGNTKPLTLPWQD